MSANKDTEAKTAGTEERRSSSTAAPMNTVEMLLKNPADLVDGLRTGSSRLNTMLGIILVLSIGTLAYGAVIGSFSGGAQIYLASLKIWAGFALAALFCFPSFYIFSCLAQADISPGESLGIMLGGLTLSAILLMGFAPVAWVFSQSTNGIAFMGFFHLLFWLVSLSFGKRFIYMAIRRRQATKLIFVRFWALVFLLTSLQMMTAIRPLMGTSETVLPEEKKFFLEHWLECMSGESGKNN